MCQEKVCRRKDFKERHPKTCTYFARHNMCRYKDRCAFKHKTNKDHKKFEDLKKEVNILKAEIVKLSSKNIKIKDKVQNLESETNLLLEIRGEINNLNNTIKHIAERVLNIEQSNTIQTHKEAETSDKCEQCTFFTMTYNTYEAY